MVFALLFWDVEAIVLPIAYDSTSISCVCVFASNFYRNTQALVAILEGIKHIQIVTKLYTVFIES